MKTGEQGFLLLTSHLGDPESKPLTVAQFRTLAKRISGSEKPQEHRTLEKSDLTALGYDDAMACRILFLLSREEQLQYYVNRAKKTDCVPVTRISHSYPSILRKRLGLNSPGCLWIKGEHSLLNTPAVSLVGSRELGERNQQFAAEAGRQAAKQGFTLISGNARGADRRAQQACLDAGGRVISIVADQLENCQSNSNVLYVSEDGFDLPFSAQRALSRNRLIHAMGAVTLVAQCSLHKGGTWKGTEENLRHGYSAVFCFRDESKVMQELIGMGACPIDLKELQNLAALEQQNISLFD